MYRSENQGIFANELRLHVARAVSEPQMTSRALNMPLRACREGGGSGEQTCLDFARSYPWSARTFRRSSGQLWRDFCETSRFLTARTPTNHDGFCHEFVKFQALGGLLREHSKRCCGLSSCPFSDDRQPRHSCYHGGPRCSEVSIAGHRGNLPM